MFPGGTIQHCGGLLDQIVGSRGNERLGVTERTRYPHERTLRLQRTIQEAIGQQLKKEVNPPTELSTELATLLAKMNERENQR